MVIFTAQSLRNKNPFALSAPCIVKLFVAFLRRTGQQTQEELTLALSFAKERVTTMLFGLNHQQPIT
jgi:hypothetical protein